MEYIIINKFQLIHIYFLLCTYNKIILHYLFFYNLFESVIQFTRYIMYYIIILYRSQFLNLFRFIKQLCCSFNCN